MQEILPPYKHQSFTSEFIANNPRVFITSDAGCVDAETEYLTPTGWKQICEYNEGELVAQFHPETQTISFVKPASYVVKPCDEFLHLKTKTVDQMLSEEHRVLYYTGNDKPRVISAHKLVENHKQTTNGFRGRIATTGLLDATVIKKGTGLTEPELRVMVAVIADGHFHMDCPNRCAINIKKEHKKTRLKELLENANIEYKQSELKDGYSRFYFAAPIKTKHFNEQFWNATQTELIVLLDEVQYWDSCLRKANAISFSSYDKRNADFVQYCAVVNNRTANISVNTRERRGKTEIEYVCHIQANSKKSQVSSYHAKSEIKAVTPTIKLKFCFEVNSGFLFLRRNGKTFATGNTGKTRSVLDGFDMLLKKGEACRMLVLAPLSILRPAWIDDCQKYTPHLTCMESTSGSEKKRTRAFKENADIVVTNHDSVKWLVKNKHLLAQFDVIAVDESTAFKHRTSDRSKAIKELVKQFPIRIMMTATPTSNTVCDIWHQAYLLDDGVRLGRMFHGFRMQVCEPVQAGPRPEHVKWVDKFGAEDIVAERLRDITVRFRFEDCIDVPPHSKHTMMIDLSPEVMKLYKQLEEEAVLMHEQGVVSAIHAGSKVQKLLQLCSGAVYDGEHAGRIFHTERYDLVIQLVRERKHSVVAFNWTHQRDELVKLAEKHEINYAVIDGSVPVAQRNEIVNAYQEGKLQVVFAHPQSAGHGLTLTRGTTTIWASPTYNAEWFQQFNARIYRAGQTQRTETIMIAARGTRETDVYEKLSEKIVRMDSLLEIFKGSTEEAA